MIDRLNLLGQRPHIFSFTGHVRKAIQPGLQGPQGVGVRVGRGTELDILPWQNDCAVWVA